MGVDAEREPHVTMPGQRLRHLGRRANPLKAGDEHVPVGVEIGEQAVAVAVLQEVRLLPPLALLGVRLVHLLEPKLLGPRQIALHHLVGLTLLAAGRLPRDGKQRLLTLQQWFRTQPLFQKRRDLRMQNLCVLSLAFAETSVNRCRRRIVVEPK
ncbi:MAG: hypothetical protein PHN77_21910 [Thermoguttaceae bacterium]|nr:hypothetical protein [Thermoguttaceae bacterium]